MNQHLSQEELILQYYGEAALGDRSSHLADCSECTSELARLAAVLDRVTPAEAPEPADDYESRVWDRLHWRLRAEKKSNRNAWVKWLAVAAVTALAFIGGLLWNRRPDKTPADLVASNTSSGGVTTPTSTSPSAVTVASHDGRPATAAQAPGATTVAPITRDRILFVVVGEHFDESERMLIELTNITPTDGTEMNLDIERAKAEELLASNRLYRRTALDRGEESVATLLDELEPILLQIAHAPDDMTAEELRSMQKRVEAKGLVFKLRVVRADVSKKSTPRPAQPTA
jgi:hypothetical protein